MNEKTCTGVSSEKEKVKESQFRSVTPSLDTPSGAGLGASHKKSPTANTKPRDTKSTETRGLEIRGYMCTPHRHATSNHVGER